MNKNMRKIVLFAFAITLSACSTEDDGVNKSTADFDENDTQSAEMKSVEKRMVDILKTVDHIESSASADYFLTKVKLVNMPDCDDPRILIEQSKDTVFRESIVAFKVNTTKQWDVRTIRGDVPSGAVYTTELAPLIVTYCSPVQANS